MHIAAYTVQVARILELKQERYPMRMCNIFTPKSIPTYSLYVKSRRIRIASRRTGPNKRAKPSQ